MMNIVICIKINKRGNGYLFKQGSRFLYLTLIKEIREKKDRCWWEKRGANCLSTSANEVLRQLLCLFATSTVRQRKKDKKCQKPKRKGIEFIYNTKNGRSQKSKKVIYYAKACEEKMDGKFIYT